MNNWFTNHLNMNRFGKRQSSTRYYFVRNPDTKNPFVGEWNVDRRCFPADLEKNDSIYRLNPIKDSLMNEILSKSSKDWNCQFTFSENGTYVYSTWNGPVGVVFGGKYMIDLLRKKILFVPVPVVVYEFIENLDGTISLAYNSALTSFYSK